MKLARVDEESFKKNQNKTQQQKPPQPAIGFEQSVRQKTLTLCFLSCSVHPEVMPGPSLREIAIGVRLTLCLFRSSGEEDPITVVLLLFFFVLKCPQYQTIAC